MWFIIYYIISILIYRWSAHLVGFDLSNKGSLAFFMLIGFTPFINNIVTAAFLIYIIIEKIISDPVLNWFWKIKQNEENNDEKLYIVIERWPSAYGATICTNSKTGKNFVFDDLEAAQYHADVECENGLVVEFNPDTLLVEN